LITTKTCEAVPIDPVLIRDTPPERRRATPGGLPQVVAVVDVVVAHAIDEQVVLGPVRHGEPVRIPRVTPAVCLDSLDAFRVLARPAT
jgi:hypothetical protein